MAEMSKTQAQEEIKRRRRRNQRERGICCCKVIQAEDTVSLKQDRHFFESQSSSCFVNQCFVLPDLVVKLQTAFDSEYDSELARLHADKGHGNGGYAFRPTTLGHQFQ